MYTKSAPIAPIEIDRATGAALAARRLAIQVPIWRLALLTQIAPHSLSRMEKGRRKIAKADLAAIDAALTSLERVLQPPAPPSSSQPSTHPVTARTAREGTGK